MGVLRHDFHQPLYAIALYKSYVQTNQQVAPISRWRTDPAGMLAKCAEALALRRAFPQELSGLYTTEEMEQADNPPQINERSGNGAGERNGSQRPFSPAELKSNFARAVAAIESKGMALGPNDYEIVSSALENLLEDPEQTARFLEYISDYPSLEEMSEADIIALQRLLKPTEENGKWKPIQEAQLEAASVIALLDEQAIQSEEAAESEDEAKND